MKLCFDCISNCRTMNNDDGKILLLMKWNGQKLEGKSLHCERVDGDMWLVCKFSYVWQTVHFQCHGRHSLGILWWSNHCPYWHICWCSAQGLPVVIIVAFQHKVSGFKFCCLFLFVHSICPSGIAGNLPQPKDMQFSWTVNDTQVCMLSVNMLVFAMLILSGCMMCGNIKILNYKSCI